MADSPPGPRVPSRPAHRQAVRLLTLVAISVACYFAGLAVLTSAFAAVEQAELPGVYVAEAPEADRMTLTADGTYFQEVISKDGRMSVLASRWAFEGEGIVLHDYGLPGGVARDRVARVVCRFPVSRRWWRISIGDGTGHTPVRYERSW
ncbi:hypothetical protein [Paludisphaera mucosa]|uniref:Uncharacterized protein n=1 Tax=Paludisphaera mucosa TaxID=3030827 RepID=A0ABT6FHK1_9BACT|nr:hypothetical protein [Paludisphaera mucosa]MDG3007047.1 hypothetical protein [Paludisphaera mucosa]